MASRRDISKSPVFNGGWDELMRVQGVQSAKLEAIETRLDGWDQRWKRLFAAVGSLALTVGGRLLYDMVHNHISLY